MSFAHRRHIWIASAAASSFVLVALGFRTSVATSGHRISRPSTASIGSLLKENGGQQLLMVVIGSSNCGASRTNIVGKALLELRDSLRVIAGRHGRPFASIGVSIDADPLLGLKWLEEIGGFDEVAAGQHWANTAAIDYVWRMPHTVAATPQVIIALRTFQQRGKRLHLLDEHVLLRMVGSMDILSKAGIRYADELVVAAVRSADTLARKE